MRHRLLRVLSALMLMSTGAITPVLVSAAAPAAAGAITRTALIDGASVSGAEGSIEYQAAVAAGFTVTIVDGATWGGYTSADFAAYDLLIVGDPSCGSLDPNVTATVSAWGPVVMGTYTGTGARTTQAGNRIVVGTDPIFHTGGNYSNARAAIIKDGIAYAGSALGTTGMYLDTTCGGVDANDADLLTSINAISAGSGAWTIDSDPPCGGAVSLIADNPAFANVATTNLEGWGCSVHTSYPTFTSDWSALAVATDAATTPTCGVDPADNLEHCGEAYILIAGTGIVVESKVISVSPVNAAANPGGDHLVVANVHDASGAPPVAGQHVDFNVTGVNAGATGVCAPVTCISGADGNVSFTYHDNNGAGADTIKASFTDGLSQLQTATSQMLWQTTAVTNGGYSTVTPKRLLDTREAGQGPCIAGTRDLVVAGGTTGVPLDAGAVALNVTVVTPWTPGFLTVFPKGDARPLASSLNYETGSIVANTVYAKVGADASISIYANAGCPHVLVDLVGYFDGVRPLAPGGFGPLTPTRILDTRESGQGPCLTGARDVQIRGVAGVPDSAGSVALNVTAVNPGLPGFLTLWPSTDIRPLASSANYIAGKVTPNGVTVKIGDTGKISIFAQQGCPNIVIDVVGYFEGGDLIGETGFVGVAPHRLLDTREAGQGPCINGVRSLTVTGGTTTIPTNATAISVNLTAVGASLPGYLTAYPAGGLRPIVSNLNYTPGSVTPNGAIVTIGAGGQIDIYGQQGCPNVIVDVFGYFVGPTPVT